MFSIWVRVRIIVSVMVKDMVRVEPTSIGGKY